MHKIMTLKIINFLKNIIIVNNYFLKNIKNIENDICNKLFTLAK